MRLIVLLQAAVKECRNKTNNQVEIINSYSSKKTPLITAGFSIFLKLKSDVS